MYVIHTGWFIYFWNMTSISEFILLFFLENWENMLVKNRKNNSRQYFVKYGEKLEENIEVGVCDASKRYFF